MNKKIIAVLSLLIVVAGASAVSAFGFDDILGGDSNNETVTIDEFEFNIPAGFEETGTPMHDNVSQSGSVKATTDMVFYKNDTELFHMLRLLLFIPEASTGPAGTRPVCFRIHSAR